MEVVVHVTTLEQWKSVLDVWFNQGHEWFDGYPDYLVSAFRNSGRYLILYDNGDIVYSNNNNENKPFIGYSEFMDIRKKRGNKMELWAVLEDGQLTNKDRWDTDNERSIYQDKESAISRTKHFGCQFHSYEIIKFVPEVI